MIDIAEAVKETKAKGIKVYPQHKNRASEIGHPCAKYLTLLRTNWADRSPHDVGLQFIFDRGNAVEERALSDIAKAGFRVVETQRPFEWKEYELTGMIDAKVEADGGLYPLEVKALSPYVWPSLNTIEDFHRSNRLWIRKYPAQLMIYLLMAEEERGIFYIVNGMNWEPKCVWVELDYEYADKILNKIKAVNQHIKDGTFPEGIADPDICPDCPFISTCLPEIIRDPISIDDDPELEEELERWEELKPYNKEYEKLDKALKVKLEGIEQALVGNFLIMGKYQERKGYTVEDTTYWRKSVKRLETA